MKVIKAPELLDISNLSIFLAGSIEMGKAIDWQTKIINSLTNYNITILNPRRNDWDTSWEQNIENPKFYEQVKWELDALNISDLIVMYFDPKTMSPIVLLELGLYATSKKLVVCCPQGFWRKGNVDIICNVNNIPQEKNIENLIKYIKKWTEI